MIPINLNRADPEPDVAPDERLLAALSAADPSTRLAAALTAGTRGGSRGGSRGDATVADKLVARCAVEPDFFVRDMLTWALTRLPAEITVPRLRDQLKSPTPQARSQALHTLSKIGDRSAWSAITPALLCDPDDDVARTAWRTAVTLAPDDEKAALAERLAAQLGRGGREVQLSLSRALLILSDVVGEVVGRLLQTSQTNHNPRVRAHASATEHLLRDPDAGFDVALHEAKRLYALSGRTADLADDEEGQAAC